MQAFVNKRFSMFLSFLDKGGFPLFYSFSFMLGIAVWRLFVTENNVALWAGLSTLSLCFGVIFYLFGRKLWIVFILLQSLFLGGVVYYKQYVQHLQPLTGAELLNKTYWIDAKIEDISLRKSRSYLIVNVNKIYNYKSSEYPNKLRLSVPNSYLEDVSLGDNLTGQFYLQAISGPTFEGDFDFPSYAQHKGFSATGYLRGDFYATKNEYITKETQLYEVREDLTSSLALNYENGGLLAALTTAMRGFVSVETKKAFQDSGLSHLLAISGMHLGFLAGFVFFFIRGAVALSERLSHKLAGKKLAAVCAFAICWIYAALAGFTIPTLRAAILLSALFIAIFIERQRLQMRILAFAALFVLVLWPEALFGASFQMSFATAAVLIYWANSNPERSVGYFKLILITTLIAGLITMPLVAYHFSKVSLAGFGANLAAIPLTAFVLLPTLFIGVAFQSELLLSISDWATGKLVLIAGYMSSFELSSIYVSLDNLVIVSFLSLISLFIFLTKSFSRLFLLSLSVFVVSLFTVNYIGSKQDDRLYYMAEGHSFFMVKEGLVYKIKSDLSNRKYKRIMNFFAEKRGLKNTDKTLCDLSQGCVVDVSGKSILVPTEEYYPQVEDCSEIDAIFATEADSFKNLYCYDKVKLIDEDSRSANLSLVNKGLHLENYPK